MATINIVFVHGWSVTNVNTYGELPLRLRAEAAREGININVDEIFLGKYISFHDEVRVGDISRAFRAAVEDQLSHITAKGGRFICITHSTGGPVIRAWWHRYYPMAKDTCPMSHLIMMAPANYGSALAQLGKARVGRLMSWKEGIDPGQGVLDWLELGSSESWELNKEWITSDGSRIKEDGPFLFVLTGEYIDRSLYDVLNNYTGEMGSDGVVRVAAANLEGRYIKLEQPVPSLNTKGEFESRELEVTEFNEAPPTPLRVITNKSHSGEDMGIIRSVKKEVADDESYETIRALLDCIKVKNRRDYNVVYTQFAFETSLVQESERVEHENRLLLTDRIFIHDLYSMVIFHVRDNEGHPVRDYDLLITGAKDNPNQLPAGFFVDKQRNRVNPETITYFINYNVIQGIDEVFEIVKNKRTDEDEHKVLRPKLEGIDILGLVVKPRPDKGFVKYVECSREASKELFEKALVPNTTTLVEIVLKRVVHEEVFRLDPLIGDKMPTKEQGNFKEIKPGKKIVK